ncbi:uncharacterized protein LOC125097031 [Lutra lutra]|uniref:uncharacterized protein LOC125097031 n=1 Tax=Lutra lutra TaxID=9657 RepID=UPI001FD1B1DA|nr:uncharacterized protein LOC125097031 [Lutra lutra]
MLPEGAACHTSGEDPWGQGLFVKNTVPEAQPTCHLGGDASDHKQGRGAEAESDSAPSREPHAGLDPRTRDLDRSFTDGAPGSPRPQALVEAPDRMSSVWSSASETEGEKGLRALRRSRAQAQLRAPGGRHGHPVTWQCPRTPSPGAEVPLVPRAIRGPGAFSAGLDLQVRGQPKARSGSTLAQLAPCPTPRRRRSEREMRVSASLTKVGPKRRFPGQGYETRIGGRTGQGHRRRPLPSPKPWTADPRPQTQRADDGDPAGSTRPTSAA